MKYHAYIIKWWSKTLRGQKLTKLKEASSLRFPHAAASLAPLQLTEALQNISLKLNIYLTVRPRRVVSPSTYYHGPGQVLRRVSCAAPPSPQPFLKGGGKSPNENKTKEGVYKRVFMINKFSDDKFFTMMQIKLKDFSINKIR